MNSFIYKEACPDYYPKTPSKSEFIDQIHAIEAAEGDFSSFLYVDEHKGIRLIGLTEKIWETVKGFFGFENRTRAVLVKSETLKLLYYGSLNHYLDKDFIYQHVNIVRKYLDLNNRITTGDLLPSIIQEALINFCSTHEKELSPGCWKRLCVAPQIQKIATNQQASFGTSHLTLAQQIQNHSAPLSLLQKAMKTFVPFLAKKDEAIDRQEALNQYEFAFNSGNFSPFFQDLLRDRFQEFVKVNWTAFTISQKQQVFSFIHLLSTVVYSSSQYSESEKYAAFGLNYFPKSIDLGLIKCRAQYEQNKDGEAMAQFQQLINNEWNQATHDQRQHILEMVRLCVSKAQKDNRISDLEKYCQFGLKYFPANIELAITFFELLIERNRCQEIVNHLEKNLFSLHSQLQNLPPPIYQRLFLIFYKICMMAPVENKAEIEKRALISLKFFPYDLEFNLIKAETQLAQGKFLEANKGHELLKTYASEKEIELRKANSLNTEPVRAKLIRLYCVLGQLASRPDGYSNYVNAAEYCKKAWQLDKTNPELKLNAFRASIRLYDARKQTSALSYYVTQLINWNSRTDNDIDLLKESLAYIEGSPLVKGITPQEVQDLMTKLEEHKQYDQASQLYEQAIGTWGEQEKLSITYHTAIAYTLKMINQGKLTDVKDAYNQLEIALQRDQKNKYLQEQILLIVKQLGKAHNEKRQYELAMPYLERALALNPSKQEEEEIKDELSDICYNLALEYIEKCLIPYRLEGSDWDAHKNTHAKDLQKALEWYNRCISYDPENGGLYFEKAELLNFFEMQQESDLKAYHLAVQHSPDKPFYWLRLAEIYASIHNSEDAKEVQEYRDKALSIKGNIAIDFMHWYDERFHKQKTTNIDPHKYK